MNQLPMSFSDFQTALKQHLGGMFQGSSAMPAQDGQMGILDRLTNPGPVEQFQPLQYDQRQKLSQGWLEEEPDLLAKEQARKKANLDREGAIEKASSARKAKRSEKRAVEESEQSARRQLRREAYLASEQKTADAQEARRLKAKKLTSRG